VLSSSVARSLELSGYGLIVVSTVSGVLLWDRLEKVAERLHLAAGLIGYTVVVYAIQAENDRHLSYFPCHLGVIAPYQYCDRPGSAPGTGSVPSWDSTALHSLPFELLLTVVTAGVTTAVRWIWRRSRPT
jgi:hypothetical protein